MLKKLTLLSLIVAVSSHAMESNRTVANPQQRVPALPVSTIVSTIAMVPRIVSSPLAIPTLIASSVISNVYTRYNRQ